MSAPKPQHVAAFLHGKQQDDLRALKALLGTRNTSHAIRTAIGTALWVLRREKGL